jgi:hypothetical protein
MIYLILFLVLWFASGVLIAAHWCSKSPSYVLDSEFLAFLFGAGLMGPMVLLVIWYFEHTFPRKK